MDKFFVPFFNPKSFLLILLTILVGKAVAQVAQPSGFELNMHIAPATSNLKNNKFDNNATMQMGFIGGIDMAYYFKAKGKLRTGISAGLGYSYYSTKLGLNYKDSLWIYDADNEQVHLFEKGDNLSETQKAGFIDLPILLCFGYALSPKIEAYLNAGAYFSFVLGKKYNTSASYTASGYYSKYNALLYNIDVASSPYFYPTGKAMSDNGSLQLNSNMGILAGVGLKYWMTPAVAFTVGINSYMGLKNISGYNNTSGNPLVGSDQRVGSLMGRSDNVKTIAYGFQVGVTIRLPKGKPHAANPVASTISAPSPVPVVIKDTVQKRVPVIKDTLRQAAVKEEVKKETRNPKIAVSGKLTDSKSNISVQGKLVFKENNSVRDSVRSAVSTGEFIANLMPGTYDIEISAPGYVPVIERLELTQANPSVNTLEFKLSKIEKGTIFKFRNISFQTGTDKLTEESYSILDIVSKPLIENPALQIEIAGHTDNLGNETGNHKLSQKRANAVVKYLIDKGVAPKQLKAMGYGSSRPIADNTTDDGRAQNRRVEFTVVGF